MSGLDFLLGVLAERKLAVRFSEDGQPRLVGRDDEVTPSLREMLAIYRDEVIAHFRQEETTQTVSIDPHLREWRWPAGMTFRERDILPPEHRDTSHPSRASHWRYEGETEWRPIEREDIP